MADYQKDRFIQYLAEQHREDELTRAQAVQGCRAREPLPSGTTWPSQ